MKIPFTKMQGLGNDFVVFDFVNHPAEISNEQFAQIADRRFGIGCDQILIIEPSNEAGVDFHYRIHNADGSEVGQCGNGARCVVEFARAKGLSNKTSIVVSTSSGLMTLESLGDHQVKVNMGLIKFEPEYIPFISDQIQETYLLNVAGEEVTVSVANIGNPHALILVEDIDTAPVDHLGPAIESHPQFPERVNVGFMQILSRKAVNLRVFERGAGETLACGSGACAAVALGQKLGLLDEEVHVNLPGGSLRIQHKALEPIYMTGLAHFVFDGVYQLES